MIDRSEMIDRSVPVSLVLSFEEEAQGQEGVQGHRQDVRPAGEHPRGQFDCSSENQRDFSERVSEGF